MSNFYNGKRAALLTMHGKEKIIAPILEPALGCSIAHTSAYDTDSLGTFSGEIQRLDSQINTARTKAKIGMDITMSHIGIANEGAFIPDPFTGMMPWNIEVTIWVDTHRNLEVVGIAQGPARDMRKSLRNIQELENFAHEAGFPEHHIVLKSDISEGPKLYKGISDRDRLINAFHLLMNASKNHPIDAEIDLRAFCNPTRQLMIKKSTQNLLAKLQSSCPSCSSPGYWFTDHEAGLPCRHCGRPTKLANRYKWTCNRCDFHNYKPASAMFAEPEHCDNCNP